MEAIILALVEAAIEGYHQWQVADAATQAALEQQATQALATLAGAAVDEAAGHATDMKTAEDALKP